MSFNFYDQTPGKITIVFRFKLFQYLFSNLIILIFCYFYYGPVVILPSNTNFHIFIKLKYFSKHSLISLQCLKSQMPISLSIFTFKYLNYYQSMAFVNLINKSINKYQFPLFVSWFQFLSFSFIRKNEKLFCIHVHLSYISRLYNSIPF